MISRPVLNVTQCGLGLCLILFSFFAMSSVEEITLNDLNKHDPSISKKGGYYSQTIMYGSYVLANLISAPIVGIFGCRWSLVIGSFGYTLFTSQFLYLSNVTLYAFSVFEGLGSGIMWTAIGTYMALNSDVKSIGRNSSILWLLCSASNLMGGIYLLCVFGLTPADEIDHRITTILYGTFCGVAVIGNIVFALLRIVPKEIEMRKKKRQNVLRELFATFRLIRTKKMILLMFPYSLTGLLTSFYSSVYPTSLAFTKKFDMPSKMVLGMNNVAVGIGQIVGCVLCMCMDDSLRRMGRYSILILSTILSVIAYILIALVIPGEASYEETFNTSIIPPSPVLTVIAGFLLGIVDSSFNTQLYAITSSLFEDSCPQAMALFKFYHAILSTVSMFYGSVVSLLIQIILLTLLTIVSTFTYAMVERQMRIKEREKTVEDEEDSTQSINCKY